MLRRPSGAFYAAFLALSLFAASDALAWWNDSWAFRKEITFDASAAAADVPETSADVPVLIRLSLANFSYFADAKPDGSDFRFLAADDKTPLKFHIEKYDSQAQIALVWLRLPQLTGGGKTDKVFLYYGNKDGKDAADAPGSYDGNQALVYHFGTTPVDSSSFKNEPQELPADMLVPALIGQGAHFAGTQKIVTPANPSLRLDPAKGMTLSAWVKADAADRASLLSLSDGSRELALGLAGGRAVARWRDASGREVAATQPAALAVGEWHHLALRAVSGKLSLLVDGVVAAQVDAALQDMTGGLTIGNGFVGDLDEVQVANVARSEAWIKAAARSQGMDAPLVVYGGDAQKESDAGQSYFASTLRNVTVDGWVIIGVLAVMFFASVLIMIFKIIYLNRIASGNAKFLEAYHQMRDDPSVLEKTASETDGNAYGISTLWRLYHHGMAETLKRLDSQRNVEAGQRVLSGASIEAIRATLDATQTRSAQGMTSQMVWLTIAISGGPFLGLLGTVVGVMITFAAIAAAGEVNVNAIAPGTAAALVATVAGLGVAIPCLFGYNYLNTRIKDVTTDMRVFIDEFVTRIAETYS